MLKTLKARFRKGGFDPLNEVEDINEGEIVEFILKKNIKNLRYVGMWKDRDDIKNGIDYVQKIRLWKRIDYK